MIMTPTYYDMPAANKDEILGESKSPKRLTNTSINGKIAFVA